jgi:hypothetical protein
VTLGVICIDVQPKYARSATAEERARRGRCKREARRGGAILKIHFLDLSEPILKHGEDQTAICGAVVKSAEPVLMFDTAIVDWDCLDAIYLCLCRRCMERELDNRFLYGIVTEHDLIYSFAKVRVSEQEFAVS